jgi:hypothetical protein
MAVLGQTRTGRHPLRPLSKQEIDRRIEGVLSEVAAPNKRASDPEHREEDELRPIWISTAEFVRRMRAFLVSN